MYNREKSVAYAQQWALHRNPKYANFDNMGGDCTNFISQCFFAGGINYSYHNYGWFYHSLSNRSPSWSGVDELFTFSTNNTHINGPQLQIASIENMQLGDIIQLFTNGNWSHTLIISKLFNPKIPENIYVCAHSIDALNKPLITYNYQNIRFLQVTNK